MGVNTFEDITEVFELEEETMMYVDGPLQGWLTDKVSGLRYEFWVTSIVADYAEHWTLVPADPGGASLFETERYPTEGEWLSVIDDRRPGTTSRCTMVAISFTHASPIALRLRHPREPASSPINSGTRTHAQLLEALRLLAEEGAGPAVSLKALRTIVRLGTDTFDHNSEAFSTLRGIESECDTFPDPSARNLYEAEYLQRLDTELSAYLQEVGADLVACSRELLVLMGKGSEQHEKG